ncbi:MAG: FAD-linked oxidase C-terminal domain-containing protein [Rhodanobacteraceae bacterium]
MPKTFEAVLSKPFRTLTRDDGVVAEKSLFVPATEDGMNGLERNVACYVDGKAATHWWFRNVARSQYGLQGWRKHKVYPDLVAAVRQQSGDERMRVLETKGQHIKGNDDSGYKRDLFKAIKHDVSLPVSRMAAFVEDINLALQQAFPGIRHVIFGHLGDGNRHYNVARGGDWADDALLASRMPFSSWCMTASVPWAGRSAPSTVSVSSRAMRWCVTRIRSNLP